MFSCGLCDSHLILFWLNFLQVNANGQFCGVAEMQITGSKIDGVGSKNMHLGIIGVI